VEHQWLTSIILATWEAEIGRIAILARQGKKFVRSHFDGKKLGCGCVFLSFIDGRKHKNRKTADQVTWVERKTLFLK
jgi:hypothetical protein